jgi:hypothetical protein
MPIDLEKQLTFAVATTLTAVAKEAQSAVVEDIQETFTTRGNWYLPRNKFGIKIEAARKDHLSAAVKTEAYWLAIHETGGIKTPGGKYLAIPTDNVRRTKRQIIKRSQRPRNLIRPFVLNTINGPVLFQRKNKRAIVPLYQLEPKAKIKKESTVIETTVRVVRERFSRILGEKLAEAIRTAR